MAVTDASTDGACRTVALMRLSMGASSIVAPRVVARAVGLDPDRNPAGPLIARMFGVRNVAIAVRLLGAQGGERDYWLRAGVAMDVVDGLAVLAGRARGYVPARTAVVGVTAALAAIAAGGLALRR